MLQKREKPRKKKKKQQRKKIENSFRIQRCKLREHARL
uniref:Uncharacterized protein n=1 Tax=Rhizophora mucronata TaxID=61149 RepID=A0A2P2PGA2_RHIMU